jgi:SpoVK/Ycf46/Vps4 family AAA+-type ATPase
MLRKRKLIQDNTLKISNYNAFLYNLDNSKMKNQKECCNFVVSENELDAKIILDNLLNQIELNFKYKLMDNKHFNGLTHSDKLFQYIQINDPNIYSENVVKNEDEKLADKNKKIKRRNNTPINKTMVNIKAEINNIGDLLELINDYKLLPDVEYNINMASLQKIKEPLEEMNNMIGMNELKGNIVDQILYFAQDLHKNKNSQGDFMHTVIYGPPGTGKTEIAKLMGKIYSTIGILKKGTFKKVTRSDLIAGYLGQTAIKTSDVIKEALGGVLFIDEAYALGNPEKRDSFAKECIDTLCEALSDNKENLMVIIAGYENELKECFFNYNQGLDSRFVWRFKTEEYKPEELHKIFVKKVNDIGWSISENSGIHSDFFKKNMSYFKYFGRDMETLLAKTKIAHSKRVFCCSDNQKRKLILKDLENGLEMYLKNDDIKKRKETEEFKKQLYSSMYC